MKQTQSMRAAIIILSLGGNTNAFIGNGKRQRAQMSTVTFYRSEADSYMSKLEDPIANAVYNKNPLAQTASKKLPLWLSIPRDSLLSETLDELKSSMMKSFFTESEALKLQFAIEEASFGDRQKMAGAAELCLIMVETMEMGLNALVAAAFHYCACVKAREEEAVGGKLDVWEHKQHKGIQMFGSHAVDIAKDASRLKQLEMVFSSIKRNPTTNRVSPDLKDAENLKNLLLSESKDWRALAIRSAACLYRLRGLEKAELKSLTPDAVRASREALYVFAPLASRLGMHRLKSELEEAAFRTLYRRQYRTVASLSRQIRNHSGRSIASSVGESMNKVLDHVSKDMKRVLSTDPVFGLTAKDFKVSARVKEPYSMWRKMLRNRQRDILEVPDALALRIVLNAKKMSPEEDDVITAARERALCYYIQQLCTMNWAPLEGNSRFKDYIDRPKHNGYQSLHYTATTEWEGEPWTMEIQIRSGEMHEVAEYGLASHWDYKSKGKDRDVEPTSDYSSGAYVKSLKEWHWQQHNAIQWDATPASSEPDILCWSVESRIRAERIRARKERLAPYIEALTTARSDLARDHIFVFLSQADSNDGHILTLPAGARVVDALREGKVSGKAFHNGSIATRSQKLNNGDVISFESEPEFATVC
mmetsp:Transcript_17157/g.24794  ORF Transcript_17157/g.24794 Transcript_17157/m.24794 type:complete len:647 (-) Transcript_17157:139-2079(-)|eukprot:CAMPEP_0202449776 /NCGR_PEP_ID=MMETSP1360-20130828/8478_1 /ASSEMBLY_ACC=CAM_ASM_000848 /TAXON_ID=515479 /ORGANISM="Licmophora paradoxa, Strain CCMP2313" /LENGTH=646 /DNA_ID=CAMNT_0049067813 /DNA_START=570 /DNA_END=2510 /DNA_ORIENTATION=+